MESETGLRLSKLSMPAVGYEQFTYDRFRHWLSYEGSADSRNGALVVGAEIDGEPVGLALLSEPYGEGLRRLYSIAVHENRRRQGIGKRLLAASEHFALAEGTQRLLAFHSSRMAQQVAFSRLLQSAGWSDPQPIEYRLAGRARWVFDGQREWGFLLSRLERQGYSTLAWTDRTDDDRRQIERLAGNQEICPPMFNPTKWDPHAESAVSILIRQHDQAVGWVIGQRRVVSNERAVFHYTCGWVIPRLSRTGWLIGGVIEVCRRQAEAFGPETLSIFETQPENLAMRKFMWERLKPAYALWTDIRYRSEKVLEGGSV